MPSATQIETLFSDYLDSNVRKGALLINGEWGTGKTQLALVKLKPLAETKGFKTAYLSVADIDSLDAFEANLFLASYHWLGKGRMKPIAEASIKAARYWGNKIGIPLDFLVAAKNELSGKTVVFIDDLERTSIELRKRILYRLAGLHELRDTKAIILADETKISPQDGDYNTIKEKTVTRTVEYLPTFKDVADTAVKVVVAAAPKKMGGSSGWALSTHLDERSISELLSSVLENGKCRNLRSAIAAIAESCELFEHLSTVHSPLDKTIALSLTHTCAAFVIELRAHRGRSPELRTYVNATTDVQWFKILGGGNPSKDYLIDFDSKFAQGHECEIIKSGEILDYLEKGACDYQHLLQDILANRPQDESVPAYRRLNKYRTLSTQDFTRLTEDAINEISALKIRSFQLIAESAQTLFHLAEKGMLSVTALELRIRYVECLNKLAGEYLQGRSDIQLEYDSTMLFGSPQGELRVVIEHIQSKATQLEQERFRRAKIAEIERLSTDPDAFVASLNSVDSRVARSSCLDTEDANRIGHILEDLLKTHKAPHVVVYKVVRAITNRYLNKSLGISFESERHFLEQLSERTRLLVTDPGNVLLKDAMNSLQEALTLSAQSLSRPAK